MQLPAPSSQLFSALLSGNIPELLSALPDDLRPFLPALTRMVMVPMAPAPIMECVSSPAAGWAGQGAGEERRRVVQTLIIGMEEVNAIRSYLQLNFQVWKIPPTPL